MQDLVTKKFATCIITMCIAIPTLFIVMMGTCAGQDKKKNGWHSEREIFQFGTINSESGVLCDTREQIELFVTLNPHYLSSQEEEPVEVNGCGHVPEGEEVPATYHYDFVYENDSVIAKVVEINTSQSDYGPQFLLQKLTYAPRT